MAVGRGGTETSVYIVFLPLRRSSNKYKTEEKGKQLKNNLGSSTNKTRKSKVIKN